MDREISPLERARGDFPPRSPSLLREPVDRLVLREGEPLKSINDEKTIRKLFPRTFGLPVLSLSTGEGETRKEPLRVGTVLSGGQAPGGHNVIAGLIDGILSAHPDSRLIGFQGGPRGIYEGRYEELAVGSVDPFRNTGGFDIIGSGRDKIETEKQLAACRSICAELKLDGLVIIGGDDSNTTAGILAEDFLAHGVETAVAGIPKTIDGDLQSEFVEISFGFDTATKVYSELIGNICRDAASAKKYWHFIKLMGRNASHVTLECALQTHPNVTLIGEEVWEKEITLDQVVRIIADVIRRRADEGRNFGICLVPEGLIGFIPRFAVLIEELNDILAEQDKTLRKIVGFQERKDYIESKLSRNSRTVYKALPDDLEREFLMDRDSHGNLQVSQIQTEKLLVQEVGRLLTTWKAEGRFKGKFSAQDHFLGYEGRCAAPTNFDASYAYALGRTSAVMVHSGRTGYMCGVRNLVRPADEWIPCGVPLTALMGMEIRKGERKPVIRKALVQMDSKAFRSYAENREKWAMGDNYLYPGAIQYFGPPEVCDRPPRSVELNRSR